MVIKLSQSEDKYCKLFVSSITNSDNSFDIILCYSLKVALILQLS